MFKGQYECLGENAKTNNFFYIDGKRNKSIWSEYKKYRNGEITDNKITCYLKFILNTRFIPGYFSNLVDNFVEKIIK